MQRNEVIQGILDLFETPAYLEIGVDQGATFHALRATRKVAVDVRFAFDWRAAASAPENACCGYHEATSDQYFSRDRGAETFDVIFVDGLHRYEQVLRDLLNAWSCLRPGGVIIVDDVMPSSYDASLPDLDFTRMLWAAQGKASGDWMGDVYRLAYFVQAFMPAFSYATVRENHGQMILWQAPRLDIPPTTVEGTARVDYADVVLNPGVFNYKPFGEIRTMVSSWRSHR